MNDRARMALILSASLASTMGGLPFNSLPVMLGSIADSFALDAKAVGLLGSVCFAGYLVGTLGAPLWMNRVDWRVLTVVCALGAAASFAASSQVVEWRLLLAVWASIGFFASTMTCLGMRILADLPDKVRAFGIRQGVELSVTAAVLFALPPLVVAHWKYPGAALGLALVVALLGLSALHLPRHPPTAGAKGGPTLTAAGPAVPRAAWGALAIFFLYLVGNIGLWAFLERIGKSLTVAPAEMGLVFAVLKLLGGLAAFTVAAAGERLDRRSPQLLVPAGVAGGLLLLASGRGFAPFAVGAWTWEFAFTCGCVLQTAAIARADPGGRAIVLVPAAFALASMVGPGIAGYLIDGGSYLPLLGAALASTLVPSTARALCNPQPRSATRFVRDSSV